MNEKTKIVTTQISTLDLNSVCEKMIYWIDNKQKKRICVTPVNCVIWANKDNKLREIYNSADLSLADGVPLIWASKFLKNPIKGRVTGLDLLPKFACIAAERGYSFFFLGAKEGVGKTLAASLARKHKKIEICGIYSPPFAEKFSDEENNKIIEMINKAKPNVLWVSLTAPKQDHWIFEHFDKLDVNIAIGVGGAFEVTAGLIKRAPEWMQKNGLEWFYRFSQEPKRLFRRYFIEAPVFIPLLIAQKLNILRD